jgi:hypothetical protein
LLDRDYVPNGAGTVQGLATHALDANVPPVGASGADRAHHSLATIGQFVPGLAAAPPPRNSTRCGCVPGIAERPARRTVRADRNAGKPSH